MIVPQIWKGIAADLGREPQTYNCAGDVVKSSFCGSKATSLDGLLHEPSFNGNASADCSVPLDCGQNDPAHCIVSFTVLPHSQLQMTVMWPSSVADDPTVHVTCETHHELNPNTEEIPSWATTLQPQERTGLGARGASHFTLSGKVNARLLRASLIVCQSEHCN